MDCMVVTQKEFQILAVLGGLGRFCGFDLEEKLPETREELWPLLLQMAQKDEIFAREEIQENGEMGSFELTPYLRQALSVLNSCERMVAIYPGSEDCPSKCIYVADWGGTVVLQNSAVNSLELKIFFSDQPEPLNPVWDSIKETGHTLPEERESMDTKTLPFDGSYVDAGILWRRPDVLLLMEVINAATAQIEGRCVLAEEGIYPMMLLQKRGEQRKEHLSKQGIQEFLGGYFHDNGRRICPGSWTDL